MIEERRHQISLQLPPHPVVLDADPVRLIQVFPNLLNNAAQYTEREGTISLTAEMREDTPGAAQAREYRDWGWGSRSCVGLVEMHGGTVTADSAGPGMGSEFTVRLPTLGTDAAAVHAVYAAATRDADSKVRRRVLLIEDNRDARESLSILLRLRGHHIRFANNGTAGLDVAARFQPDAILLDIVCRDGIDTKWLARSVSSHGARACCSWRRPGGSRTTRSALERRMERQANRRIVGPHEDGWQVKAGDGDRASAVLKTKAEAVARAREILRNSGGGELTIQDRDGSIVDSDTVAPGVTRPRGADLECRVDRGRKEVELHVPAPVLVLEEAAPMLWAGESNGQERFQT